MNESYETTHFGFGRNSQLALCSQDQMANWWWQSIWQLSLDYHTKLGNKNVGAIVPPVFLSL